MSYTNGSYMNDSDVGMILLLTKSPNLRINTGGAPNDVLTASLYFGLPSVPIVGMVSPGLTH